MTTLHNYYVNVYLNLDQFCYGSYTKQLLLLFEEAKMSGNNL